MTLNIILNEKDIEKVIADAYGVKTENVSVYVTTETVGYGMGERRERVIKAKITTPKSGDNGCTYPDCFNCERPDCNKTINGTTDEKLTLNVKQRREYARRT